MLPPYRTDPMPMLLPGARGSQAEPAPRHALHVDDSGTGYSSLANLHRLPLDAVKIDRSFLSGRDPNRRQNVRNLVAGAHAPGVGVIGEGIESAELLDELRGLTREFGQGYSFFPPAPPAEIEPLLAREPAW
jgi:EAL domain-containing protein (putative c-di-GMP-specific phosphodiesterase class I)